MTCKLLDNKRNARPSSIDVAKLANVSQATVSRVLNHPEKVGDITKQRVYDAIQKLGYVPNQNAQQLVSGRSNFITLISGPLDNPFFVDSTAEIVKYATKKGYKVNIIIVEDREIEDSYKLVLANRPDGLIMSCILYDDPIIEHLKVLDIPFISFNRRHREKLNYVEFDNFLAGKESCLLLFNKGYDAIFWVGGNLKASTFYYRFEGFSKAYEKLYFKKLTKSSSYNKEIIDYKKLLSEILIWAKNTPGKKAIAASTDSIAINLLNELKNKGLSCPDDIGIVGIDNVNLAQHTHINLTTVGTSSNLGLIAIKSLINQIENSEILNIGITVAPIVFDRGTTH